MTGAAKRYYNDEEWCPNCGRSNALLPVRIGRAQAEWLFRLADEWGGRADHATMQLKGAIYATCSYFRYWGLTENYDGVGTFRITRAGYAYLTNELAIPQTCWRFDSTTLEFEGPMVRISDVLQEDYETYEDVVTRLASRRRIASRGILWANVERRLRGD